MGFLDSVNEVLQDALQYKIKYSSLSTSELIKKNESTFISGSERWAIQTLLRERGVIK